ncbi:MAG: diguanylate cyclase [Aquimonas sp.]|nr:diguanylate cyclase [Aquimonas sp.]
MCPEPPKRESPARTPGGDGSERPAPSDIARETLKQLASRRLAPTPENYQRVYQQISGSGDEGFPAEALRSVATALPRGTPGTLALVRQFDKAIQQGSWAAVRQALSAGLQGLVEAELPWAETLTDLVRELDPERAGDERARRQHTLMEELSLPHEASVLQRRLETLVREWRKTGTRERSAFHRESAAETFAVLLARLLQHGVLPLLADNPPLAQEARALAEAASSGQLPPPEAAQRLERIAKAMELSLQSRIAERDALLELLRLVIDNIRLLVMDDSWLHGQIGLISEALASGLDLRVLEKAARRLRKVIEKQGHLTRQISDAQQRLKAMLSGFIERLGELAESTGSYHGVLETCAERIQAAGSLDELADVVAELIQHTEVTRDTAARSAAQLSELKQKVESANQTVLVLQRELEETTELVRHDPLTGALNRKGLDEALEREIARMQKQGSRLCVVLLDVDNFKDINDTHGHLVGDEVLRHITLVLRDTLRGNDSVVRYGGEEFVLLLPGIGVDEAQQVVARLQRELTRRFFLANAQKLLLTFSAGLTTFRWGEHAVDVIDRADKAMYAAKHAGKNRVMVAEV